MWSALGIDPIQILHVAIGAFGIYLTLLVLIRLLGQRSVSSMSNIDMAAVIVLGAVGGRAVLGYTPTLLAGVVGLASLCCIRIVVAQVRRHTGGMRVVGNRPVLLMTDGRLIDENLARTHIVPSEIYSKLRAVGICRREDVACAILEPTGTISVLRCGTPIDPEFLDSVVGREQIPAAVVAGPASRPPTGQRPTTTPTHPPRS